MLNGSVLNVQEWYFFSSIFYRLRIFHFIFLFFWIFISFKLHEEKLSGRWGLSTFSHSHNSSCVFALHIKCTHATCLVCFFCKLFLEWISFGFYYAFRAQWKITEEKKLWKKEWRKKIHTNPKVTHRPSTKQSEHHSHQQRNILFFTQRMKNGCFCSMFHVQCSTMNVQMEKWEKPTEYQRIQYMLKINSFENYMNSHWATERWKRWYSHWKVLSCNLIIYSVHEMPYILLSALRRLIVEQTEQYSLSCWLEASEMNKMPFIAGSGWSLFSIFLIFFLLFLECFSTTCHSCECYWEHFFSLLECRGI